MEEQMSTGRHISAATGAEYLYSCSWVATGVVIEWKAVFRTLDGSHVKTISGYGAKGGIDAEMKRQIDALA